MKQNAPKKLTTPTAKCVPCSKRIELLHQVAQQLAIPQLKNFDAQIQSIDQKLQNITRRDAQHKQELDDYKSQVSILKQQINVKQVFLKEVFDIIPHEKMEYSDGNMVPALQNFMQKYRQAVQTNRQLDSQTQSTETKLMQLKQQTQIEDFDQVEQLEQLIQQNAKLSKDNQILRDKANRVQKEFESKKFEFEVQQAKFSKQLLDLQNQLNFKKQRQAQEKKQQLGLQSQIICDNLTLFNEAVAEDNSLLEGQFIKTVDQLQFKVGGLIESIAKLEHLVKDIETGKATITGKVTSDFPGKE